MAKSLKDLASRLLGIFQTATEEIEAVVSEAEEAEEVEAVEPPFTAPAFVQATVRKGNVVHFQAGSGKGSYRKADVTDSTLAAQIAEQIIAGEAVNPSLYGSKTQYATLTASSRTSASLANGTEVTLPSGLVG